MNRYEVERRRYSLLNELETIERSRFNMQQELKQLNFRLDQLNLESYQIALEVDRDDG